MRSLEGLALSTFHRIYDAVPTTAGTAAEATINYYVITDAEKRTFVCVYTNGIPNVAILDFDTMYTMPEKSAAATGTDALTHAMKDYTA